MKKIIQNIKLSAGYKNAILNAVSWYDESAEKVIAQQLKLSGDKVAKDIIALEKQAEGLIADILGMSYFD